MVPVEKATVGNDASTNKKSSIISIWKLRSKEQRKEMFQTTIPGWVDSKTMLPFNDARAQRIHKSIFETMVLDLVPFSEVNKPGFLRHHAYLAPNFEVASEKYYR